MPLPPSTTLRDLHTHGFVLLRGAVAAARLTSVAELVARDVARGLDGGEGRQEEPVERLSEETRREMEGVRDEVVRVVREKTGLHASVPREWSETMYGRVKRRDFHTPWHCDAMNTVFQRRLLEPENLAGVCPGPSEAEAARWSEFQTRGGGAEWTEVPIFTVWIALRDATDEKQSLLRIHAGSHALPGFELRGISPHNVSADAYPKGSLVAPTGYRYRASHFEAPEGGYRAGDVVVFHCFTMHEANPHRAGKAWRSGAAATDRVSMDFRVFARVPSLLMLSASPRACEEERTTPQEAKRQRRRR